MNISQNVSSTSQNHALPLEICSGIRQAGSMAGWDLVVDGVCAVRANVGNGIRAHGKDGLAGVNCFHFMPTTYAEEGGAEHRTDHLRNDVDDALEQGHAADEEGRQRGRRIDVATAARMSSIRQHEWMRGT